VADTRNRKPAFSIAECLLPIFLVSQFLIARLLIPDCRFFLPLVLLSVQQFSGLAAREVRQCPKSEGEEI
jgi:hypothetical protein